ncbi:NAD(P)-binding domain-containing protein [Francisellaceae bacterium]|nr:NAD(P)-binding domain-containing protein [Francisellaceae bacterium]
MKAIKDSDKKVAVIGGGASGIITARILQEAGFRVKIFEKAHSFGGTWRYSECCEIGAMYQSLRTNLPKEAMVYLQAAKGYQTKNSFSSHKDVLQYLVENATAWSLEDITYFDTQVIRIEPANSEISQLVENANIDCPENYQDQLNNIAWRVSSRNKEGFEQTEIFDFVAVCNGHFDQPLYPSLPGSDDTAIKISHSQSYRKPDGFEGVVLCVGFASSGVDISKEISDHGCEVYVAKRDVSLKEEQEAISGKSNVPHYKGFVSSPVKIAKAPGQKDRVETGHGSLIEVDHILWCTGYVYDFPFLAENILSKNGKLVHPLWKQLIHCLYPSLAFLGIPWKILPFPFFETQAIALANIWSGEIKLPDARNRIQEMHASYRHMTEDLELSKHYMHMLGDEQWAYHRDLLAFVGQLNEQKETQLKTLEENFICAKIARESNPYRYRDEVYDFKKPSVSQ